jgi:hypothetical protein
VLDACCCACHTTLNEKVHCILDVHIDTDESRAIRLACLTCVVASWDKSIIQFVLVPVR